MAVSVRLPEMSLPTQVRALVVGGCGSCQGGNPGHLGTESLDICLPWARMSCQEIQTSHRVADGEH